MPPKSRSTSAPHRRTRADHQTETAEDYVEAIAEILAEKSICRITDLAQKFSVSNVTVHRIIERLHSEGLVQTEPYRPLELTDAGEKLARKSRQRHEMVYEFLVAIGVDRETAAIDAEGIEHHVSPQTLARFKHFVENATAKR
ncbi:MAG: transcriptional regulator MntR [Planctomyces sp.]|nr:transcriptional regulator MntR [Planctomyces sp.]